jgi:hypothetical protein
MESVPSKEDWKRMVKHAVELYWKETWEQERATNQRWNSLTTIDN